MLVFGSVNIPYIKHLGTTYDTWDDPPSLQEVKALEQRFAELQADLSTKDSIGVFIGGRKVLLTFKRFPVRMGCFQPYL